MEQQYMLDPDMTIEQIVTEAIAKIGEKITVRRYTRYAMGEGLEKRQDNFDKLVISVEKLALKEQNVENDVKEIKSDVKTLTNKSGKRWDGLVDKVILILATAVITFVLSRIGL